MTTVLYLSVFDPTVGSSGSAMRGRLILRFLAERYETHVVHLEGRDPGGRDEALADRLASLTSIPYSGAGYFLFSPALYRAAAEVLLRYEVDFLFAEFEKTGGYAWLLSRSFGKPFFYASHNVEFLRSLDLSRTTPPRLGLVPGLYFWERQACRHALTTFAISEADAEVFRSWAPEGRVSVLRLAFEEKVFHPFYPDEEREPPVVLMVGNYHYAATREGARFVLDRVVARVLERHPRVVFRFVGPGLSSSLSHANVEIPGFMDDLPTEYRRAAVVIAPITSGGGIKIKVIEALAMGRFLVATPKALEGIGGRLTHVAVASLEQFAEAISEALFRRPGRSVANWEEISLRHGAREGLLRMETRIEAALLGHGNC